MMYDKKNKKKEDILEDIFGNNKKYFCNYLCIPTIHALLPRIYRPYNF